MDEELTPCFSLTLAGVTVTVGAVPFDGDMVADKEIVPVNPLILVRIRFVEADAPG